MFIINNLWNYVNMRSFMSILVKSDEATILLMELLDTEIFIIVIIQH